MPDLYAVGALICQTIVIAMTGRRVPIEEFLPVRAEEAKKPQQTPEQMYETLRALSMRKGLK